MTRYNTCPLLQQLRGNESENKKVTVKYYPSDNTVQFTALNGETAEQLRALSYGLCTAERGMCDHSRREDPRLIGKVTDSSMILIKVGHLNPDQIQALFPGVEVVIMDGNSEESR